MINNPILMGSGVDTSDATATASDIAKNKTAYVNGTKVTGTIYTMDEDTGMEATSVDADVTDLFLRYTTTTPRLYRKSNYLRTPLTNLGDATADDVAEGKTFTSSAGLKVTGTHVCSGGIDTSDATATAGDIAEGATAYVHGEKVTGNVPVWSGASWETPTAVWDDSNSRLRLYGKTPVKRIYESSSTFDMYCAGDNLGDATAADVAAGKTFTSSAGLKVTGTAASSVPTLQAKTATPSTAEQTVTPDSGYDGLSSVTVEGDANLVPGNIKSGVSIFGVTGSFEGSGGGGGSGDNNCEAYHITSASAAISFKGSGTVKVWGYGSKKSNYSTTVYAFVGDGYYAGSSYGTPSKTSASFSIASDGTLNGLPSGLTAVDLLVTIGV